MRVAHGHRQCYVYNEWERNANDFEERETLCSRLGLSVTLEQRFGNSSRGKVQWYASAAAGQVTYQILANVAG
jgi:hypothetical protein